MRRKLSLIAPIALILTLASPPSSPAAPAPATPPPAPNDNWLKLKSTHYELFTNASDKRGRELLTRFERIHSFFSKDIHRDGAAPMLPARIVAFKSAKEFEPFRPNEVAAAFYRKSADGHYIAMLASGEEHVVYHEFMHLMLAHLELKLPVWMNEGIAELYATLTPTGKKIQVGALIPSHFYAIRQEKWIPVSELLAATHDSPLYNRKQHAGAFYAESWALMHMLFLSAEYRPQFGAFSREMLNGSDGPAAFRKIFQKDTTALDKELQAYFRSDRFFAANFNETLTTSYDATPAEPATPLEIGMVLAGLARPNLAAGRYQDLAQQFPTSPDPHAGLGYTAWMQQDSRAAQTHFARAFQLGSENKQLLWDLARLSQGHDDASSTASAEKLLKLEPQHTDAKILLAHQYLRLEKNNAAFSVLSDIKSVKPDQARMFFWASALALDRMGELEKSLASAERLHAIAGNADETAQARQLTDYLKRKIEHKKTAVHPTADSTSRAPFSGEPGPPSQSRRYTQPNGQLVEETVDVQRSPHGEPLQQLEGKFVQLDCVGSQAKVVLQTAPATRAAYLITEPSNLIVTQSGQGQRMDLTCGPQNPAPTVKLSFEPKPDPKLKTTGIVWRLEFN